MSQTNLERYGAAKHANQIEVVDYYQLPRALCSLLTANRTSIKEPVRAASWKNKYNAGAGR